MKTIEERVFDFIEATGLNWTVNKEPLISEVGSKKTSSFGLFRNDTGAHLDTVKGRYEVFQNHELAENVITATDQLDLTATRGGVLNSGRHVYLQAELPEEFIGKSALKRWITGLNVHGGGSVAFGSSNVVVVCQNTFYRAFGDLSKFRHTATVQDRVKEFVKAIRQAMGLERREIEVFKTMADVPFKEEIMARLMAACFDLDLNKKQSEMTERSKTKTNSIITAVEAEVVTEGPTLWGLFNGITRYTNHVAANRGKKEKTPEELLSYVMVGEGYEVNLKAYKTIHAWLLEQKLIEPEPVWEVL
jgi:phage/plasmid-like protein (TIGR03299 family)